MSISADVVIIGGGVIGSSIAYHLAAAGQTSVIVIERDPSYARASSALSASSIRQQFTTPACTRMSQAGFEFLRRADEHLGVDGELAGVSLTERGYLYLATPELRATLDAAIAIQHDNNVHIRRMDQDGLAAAFPWLNSSDLALGAFGMAGEGWFDGYSLLQAFRRKARSMGVRYLMDEAVGFEREGDQIRAVLTMASGAIGCDVVVDAAGPNAAAIAGWAGCAIPVRPERRCVFVFSCPDPLPDLPMVIDPHGVYVRPEGKVFIAGGPATTIDDPDPFSLVVDYDQFDEVLWPTLAHRIPAFERIRMRNAWAGHYDKNTFDHNALIGWAPGVSGLMLATGFSGHGMQHSPAAGRGVAELLTAGRFTTLDLRCFSPERLVDHRPLVELNIT